MGPPASSGVVFRFGLFEADVARNTLTLRGVRVKIQDQPFRVLTLLLERPGEIVTREELRRDLWPEGTYVDFEGSLNAILKKLRAALHDDSDNPRFIETVPRRGYRFIAPVSLGNGTAEASSSTQETQPQIQTVTGVTVPKPAGYRARPMLYAAVALVLSAAIGVGWARWHKKHVPATPEVSSSQAAKPAFPVRKSVAVLGFDNLAGKPDDRWLATAFAEMLSTELAAGEELRLISGEDVANLRRSSPWSETGTLGQQTTARIGTALNSDVLVLGSYASVGKPERRKLRFDVRLQDARTGQILAEVAEIGGNDDLFQLVSRIGAKLRSRLGVSGTAENDEPSVIASMPSNAEAARLYALGLAKLRDFDDSDARDLLQQAIQSDPKFPLSHAMLARAWAELGYEQKRKEEAKRALALSAHLPRVSRMLVEGDYYESLAQHEKASSTYKALFELFPDSVEYGLQLVNAQILAGHANQAKETIARLRRLPLPASLDPRIDLAESRISPRESDDLALLHNALEKASAQGKKLVYARARLAECNQLVYGEHPDRAVAPCNDAYDTFLSTGNNLGAANALGLLGDQQGGEGHIAEARAYYRRALKILQGLGEHRKTALILNNMAIGFTNEGNLERGEQLYRQARLHFEQAGDKANTAATVANISDILYLRGNLPAAERGYRQAVEILASVDQGDPGYALCRLADLALMQGRVQDAHRLAAQAIDSLRAKNFDSHEAISELGDVLEAEGNLSGARQQYQAALDIRQSRGRALDVAESQASLGALALEEGHPDQAEALLRSAIAECEKEKAGPSAASTYVVLSRALLMQNKFEESRQSVRRAADLARGSPDPTLSLPVAIQRARIEAAAAGTDAAGHRALDSARQQLRSAIAAARKLGFYEIECEARLTLAEAELKANPALARSQLEALDKETHLRGLELISRKARRLTPANLLSSSHS